ncbi:MAG: hypothetical protein NVS1B9_09080 [Solirubrobacteraceae bacterium]
MAAPPLKPEFGPTLEQLLAPRWRAASRRTRRAWIGLSVFVAALGAAIAVFYPRDGWVVHHGPPVSFNLRYPRTMQRVAAGSGYYARIRGEGASFALAPLRLPEYRGEVSGAEPLYADGYIKSLAARTPGFRLQSEGKTRVNTTPGYTFTYSAPGLIGRVVFLTPAVSNSRDGVTLVMSTVPNSHDTGPDQVAVNDVLQEPLRSFRFGT